MNKRILFILSFCIMPSAVIAVTQPNPKSVGDLKGFSTYFDDPNNNGKKDIGEQVWGSGAWYWVIPAGGSGPTGGSSRQMFKDDATGEWGDTGCDNNTTPPSFLPPNYKP